MLLFYVDRFEGLHNILITRNVLLKGHETAIMTRFWTGKVLISIACLYSAAYYFKYNSNVSYFFLTSKILTRTI